MLDSENVIVKRLVEEVSENVAFGSCNRPPLVRWENPRRDEEKPRAVEVHGNEGRVRREGKKEDQRTSVIRSFFLWRELTGKSECSFR